MPAPRRDAIRNHRECSCPHDLLRSTIASNLNPLIPMPVGSGAHDHGQATAGDSFANLERRLPHATKVPLGGWASGFIPAEDKPKDY
jgi:hypothetical protein